MVVGTAAIAAFLPPPPARGQTLGAAASPNLDRRQRGPAAPSGTGRMEPVIWWVRKSFQSVQVVSSAALEQRLAQNRDQMLLLDTRSAAEYEVSHLEGAVRIDPETTDMEHVVKELGLTDCAGGRDVVCYCTVGYRSSGVAQKLGEFLASEAGQGLCGPPKVYNLEGGLVKWANERKAIVDSQNQPTSLVHPYSAVWAPLLEPEFRARI
uniref:tRNA uridine(34) hydroxylase-like isoform X1 n=2 Tax=Pristiophorus japonicus TaxID=55135 RepID=UPI00398F85ED